MKNVAGSDKRERKKCDKDKTRDRGGRERERGEREGGIHPLAFHAPG